MALSNIVLLPSVGIAMSIAAAIFDGDTLAQAIGVPVYYGFVEAILVSSYCIWAWKRGWTKAPTDVTLWKAITTSYEVMNLDQSETPEPNIQLASTDKKVNSDGGDWDYVDYGDAGKEPKSSYVDMEQSKSAKESTSEATQPDKKGMSSGGWFRGFL